MHCCLRELNTHRIEKSAAEMGKAGCCDVGLFSYLSIVRLLEDGED
jgi:hypothetical protein